MLRQKRCNNIRGRISLIRRTKVYVRDAFQCVVCGAKERLTLEHVVPVSQGLDYGWPPAKINMEHNLVTACWACNQATRDQSDFTLEHGRFVNKPVHFALYRYQVKEELSALCVPS